ncbi:MAG: hypothetical protein C5B50_02940 [Verrucomicrobia bacterium]|nr:MAG: hypothetical protein C5B50_02940 [Verrucomicrobiota bacterium]
MIYDLERKGSVLPHGEISGHDFEVLWMEVKIILVTRSANCLVRFFSSSRFMVGSFLAPSLKS